MTMSAQKVPHGCLIFDGDKKVAVVHMNQHATDIKQLKTPEEGAAFEKGVVVNVPMKPEDFTIHFTSPQMKVADVAAAIAAIPKV